MPTDQETIAIGRIGYSSSQEERALMSCRAAQGSTRAGQEAGVRKKHERTFILVFPGQNGRGRVGRLLRLGLATLDNSSRLPRG